MKCRRTLSTWYGATRSMTARPRGVITANVPRLSPSQASRRTRPLASMRVIWCESLLRDWAVRSASSVIRSRCLWGFGQLDQDLVVVGGQPERVQVPVKLAHQHLREPDVGAPRGLLVSGEPARVSGWRASPAAWGSVGIHK